MENETTYNEDDFFVMRFYVKEYLVRNGSLAKVRNDVRRAKIKMVVSFFFAYLIVFRMMLDGWGWIIGGAIVASYVFTAVIWECATSLMKPKEECESSKRERCEWVWKTLPIEYMNVAEWGGNVKGGDIAEAKGVLYEKRVLDYVGAVYPGALGFVVICAIVVALAKS